MAETQGLTDNPIANIRTTNGQCPADFSTGHLQLILG